MIIESTAILRNATNSSDFEIGTGYLPRIEENKDGGVIIGGASLWMMDNKDEARKNAAWKFIEYTTTPEAQAKWSMATGYFAINPAAYEVPEMKTFIGENPNFLTAINQLKENPVNGYTAGVLSGVATEARTIFNEAMEKTYDGTYTPQQAVDYLAGKVNSAIQNYNASTK
jgi:sn-glycerol 3-phosphate transport system substrate-binding protein